MSIVFEDQFNGDKLDTAKWPENGYERYKGFPHTETRPGNGEFQQYRSGQVKVTNGVLEINSRPMTGKERMEWVDRVLKCGQPADMIRNMLMVSHVSGQVTTHPNKPFGPGMILRCELGIPVGEAAWPAVWAFDNETVTEVDLFEGSGRAGTDPLGNCSQGLHDFKSNYHAGVAKFPLPTAGFRTFFADWSNPKQIVFGYDKTVTGTTPVGPRMTKPMYLMIGMAVGSSNWPWIGIPNGDTKPCRFWVKRIWVEKP